MIPVTVRELVMKAAELMKDIQELEAAIKNVHGRTGYDMDHARKDPRWPTRLLVAEYDRKTKEHDAFMAMEVQVPK
jgi:hypothetical protein